MSLKLWSIKREREREREESADSNCNVLDNCMSLDSFWLQNDLYFIKHLKILDFKTSLHTLKHWTSFPYFFKTIYQTKLFIRSSCGGVGDDQRNYCSYLKRLRKLYIIQPMHQDNTSLWLSITFLTGNIYMVYAYWKVLFPFAQNLLMFSFFFFFFVL